jgi:hypothetical protein
MPVIGIAVIGLGILLGRLWVRPSPDQIVVPWREVWRDGPARKYTWNPKMFRVFLAAFGAGFVCFAVRMLAESIGSFSLAVLATASAAVSIGVGVGAMMFGGWVKTT